MEIGVMLLCLVIILITIIGFMLMECKQLKKQNKEAINTHVIELQHFLQEENSKIHFTGRFIFIDGIYSVNLRSTIMEYVGIHSNYISDQFVSEIHSHVYNDPITDEDLRMIISDLSYVSTLKYMNP